MRKIASLLKGKEPLVFIANIMVEKIDGSKMARAASELNLINFIRRRFPRKHQEISVGIGDDAMVLRNGIVVSTDSFVEGVHFESSYFTKYDVGFRSMAASLSDLAAMRSEPISALISLYLPRTVRKNDIRDLYDGLHRVARKYRVDISGGDIVESPFWGLTITVIGRTKKPLLRSGARSGQSLYVTNHLGLSEVGRNVLLRGWNRRNFPQAIAKHLHPIPRFKESFEYGRNATSGIDTSDGLSTDCRHLSEESRVKIMIDVEKIRIHPEVKKYCRTERIDPVRFILSAGEDFELLFTAFSLPGVQASSVNKIGGVEKGKGVYLRKAGQSRVLQPSGYEHLR